MGDPHVTSAFRKHRSPADVLLAPLPLFVPASGVPEPEPSLLPGRGVYVYVHMGCRMSPWKLTSLGSFINEFTVVDLTCLQPVAM